MVPAYEGVRELVPACSLSGVRSLAIGGLPAARLCVYSWDRFHSAE
jgi:hypothetical protein